MRHIKVLSGNFSAVDLGEEPCHNGLPEKVKLTERNEKGDKQPNGTARGERKGSDFASGAAQNAAVSPRFVLYFLERGRLVSQLN